MLLRFLFGDDVFISYSRRDGANYAAALANALSQPGRGLSCFLDQWGASAAEQLSAPVRRALDRSSVLVLVGTRGAAESVLVREEVQRFSRRRGLRGARPVLPINVDGAFDRVAWAELTGLHRTPDTEEARRDGLPSEPVVRLIVNSHSFARRNLRTRWLSIGAGVLLLASAAASLIAVNQRRRAATATELAQANKNEAERQADNARKNAALADERAAAADANARRADDQTARAVEQARIADAERQRTEAQTTIAEGRLLATVAERARLADPGLVQRSVLFAVEALHRLPAPETERVLRPGLGLLAHQLSSFEYRDPNPLAIAFSRDGNRLAAATSDSLQVWQVETGRATESRAMYSGSFGPIAAMSIGRDLDLVAVATRDLRVRVWDIASNRRVGEDLLHDREIRTVALSPDRELVASAQARLVRVWDLRRGIAIATLPTDDPILPSARPALAFSPDGQLLAIARLRSIDVWERSTARIVRTLPVQDDITSLSFSPQGKYLGAAAGTLWIWDAATGRSSATFGLPGRTNVFDWSADERLVATGARDGTTVRLFDLGQPIAEPVTLETGAVSSVTFTAKGARLVIAGLDGSARVWDVARRTERLRAAPRDGARLVAASLDGRHVATAGTNGTRLWDAENVVDGLQIPHTGSADSIAFAPGGEYIASVAGSNLAIWTSRQGGVIERGHGGGGGELALSPDARFVAAILADGNNAGTVVQVSGSRDGLEIARLNVPGRAVRLAGFSPNGRYLVTITDGDRQLAQVWDVGRAEDTVRVDMPKVGGLVTSFSDDGAFVATTVLSPDAGEPAGLRVWRLPSGEEVRSLRMAGRVMATFAADGRVLVTTTTTGGRTGTLATWNTSTGQRLASIERPNEFLDPRASPGGRYVITKDVSGSYYVYPVPALTPPAFSPSLGHRKLAWSADGSLAVTSQDEAGGVSKLIVWDMSRGRSMKSVVYPGRTRDLAFSTDGRLVASVDESGDAVRLWDVKQGKEIMGLTAGAGVSAVRFTPDGRRLMTLGPGTLVRLWFWRPDDLIAAACGRVTMSLPAEDYRQLLTRATPRPVCPR
jgi:WD40 repeat protein